MAEIGRPGLSSADRQRVWDLWKSGSSISEISRSVEVAPGSVFTILARDGGIYSPPQKRRPGALSLTEREEISRGLAARKSLRAIAAKLGRAPSTISREVARNRRRGHYRALNADGRAWRRAKRPQKCKLAKNPVLRGYVAARLGEYWSPEQIAQRLKKAHPINTGMHISHESIYQSLFILSRGVLGKELQACLRTRRPIRRSVHNTTSGQWRSQIKDATPIDQRPAEVTHREVAGHWEGDLLIGTRDSQIATVIERATRYTLLIHTSTRQAQDVTASLARELNLVDPAVMKTLTWDRGMELADHKNVTANTGVNVYFADPHSPWQRGTNENTNRLMEWSPKVGHRI